MFYGNFENGRDKKFRESISLMAEIFGRVYSADNLMVFKRAAGFTGDQKFVKALNLHAKTKQEFSIAWRLHTLIWAAQQALHKDGDFVECGVLTGLSFGVVTSYLDWPQVPKRLYLYDTFNGIPPSHNSEGRSNQYFEIRNAEDPDSVFNEAQARFAGLPNVELVKGIVPDTFATVCPEKISFLHIDMNSAASEIAALNALWDRVVPGGLIVFDDYGWSMYGAQKKAEDAFAAERGHSILELPTGQGLLLKH